MRQRAGFRLTWGAALGSTLALGALGGCSESVNPTGTGGVSSGGAFGSGGAATGGQPNGTGGTAAGGASGGGVATGGTAAGGASGGSFATGGGSSGGNAATGGETGSGGAATGGSGGGEVCPLPSTFSWTSTGPLAEPKSPSGRNFVSMKDFTVVHHDAQYLVYLTEYDTSTTWTGAFMKFGDWSEMATAAQTPLSTIGSLGHVVAPTLFYFTPESKWVLAYQWGFKFATATDAADPTTFGSTTNLMNGDPTGNSPTGPIDQTVICDDEDCYLFFADDNGHIYRASMPIGDFPGTFSGAVSIMSDTSNNLFEAVQVYTVKGSDPVQFLMIVEAIGGGGRFFRAFTSNDLGGTFTAMPNASSASTPFAGNVNVDFEGTAWTSEISHGDLVRYDASEKQYIDPCHLELLYQGKSSNGSSYETHPYRPGLLTLVTD